jgi:hypothetical protein
MEKLLFMDSLNGIVFYILESIESLLVVNHLSTTEIELLVLLAQLLS